jgi:hypothetical protein
MNRKEAAREAAEHRWELERICREARELDKLNVQLLSLIQSIHMHDHSPDDQDTVVEAAKIQLKGRLLTLGYRIDKDFDDAFMYVMKEYCSWIRELGYVTSPYYDEAIDVDGYQINLLEVNDVILSQETRTLLEEEQKKQIPNYYGDLEAGPYRGNEVDSDEWKETRRKRKRVATQGLMDISASMVNCLAPHINTPNCI